MISTGEPANSSPLLRIKGLHKRFGAQHAVRGVDVDLHVGEFVGLMGPNGAGKSTLIKMLAGVYEVDEGTIELLGRPVSSLAGRPEIGFVHQDLGLVDQLSVLDNLRLGAPLLRRFGPFLSRSREAAAGRAALERVGLDLPLDAPVGSLSGGQKALLAVARLLAGGARLIVVDETTSTLPPREARWFVETLSAATLNGTCVLMVSHKLSELFSAVRRIVMIIDGEKVADRTVTPDDRAEIVRLLAAHEEEVTIDDHSAAVSAPGEDLLRLEGVHAMGFGPFDLTVRSGEVVGLTGLVGSGLHTVGLLAYGAVRPKVGGVWLRPGAKRAIVAPEREVNGVLRSLPVLWNASLSALPRWQGPARLLRLSSERRDTGATLHDLRVVPSDPSRSIGSLSGGNQQKVLFTRALLQEPDLYVLCEPTRGVDVRTRHEIYRLIRGLAEAGAGVLVVTSDSEDLFAVCDSLSVVTSAGIDALGEPAGLTEDELTEIL